MTDDDLVLEEACPLCKAAAGEPCRTVSEPFRALPWCHLERIQRHYRALR